MRNGVEIVRVRSTTYERSRLSRRALNYLTYVFGVMWKGMFARRPDLVVCMTDPPFIGVDGAGRSPPASGRRCW